jgi:hypothetical protein
MTQGLNFVVADAPITVNFPNESKEIRPGAYSWGAATASYTFYSLTTPARILVCDGSFDELTPTNTPSPTSAPPAAYDAELPCVPADLAGPDERGQLPDLAFIVPTFAPLPTLVTATIVISAQVVITQVHLLVTSVVMPVQTVSAWSDTQFGPDGWVKGEQDAAPIVALLVSAFGWLGLFTILGPLNWLLPPVLITFLIRIVRAILSVVKYVKQIIPFN